MLKDWILKNWIRHPEPPPKYLCANRTATGVGASLDAYYTVPDDYDLHLQFCSCINAAGGAFTATTAYLYTRTPGMPDRTLIVSVNTRPVPIRVETLSAIGDITIPGGGTVGAYSDFSGSHAAAFVNFYFHGFLIPRLAVLTG